MEEKVRLWDIIPGYDFIEEIDMNEALSWFLDETHSVPPMTPLYAWFWIRYCGNGLRQAVTTLSIPTLSGWELRQKDGGIYVSLHIVRDKEEIEAREVKLREAFRPWIENFDGLWEARKTELLKMYEELKELDVEKASNIDLYHHHYDLVRTYQRMWEIHHEGLYASYYTWVVLDELLRERFGIRDLDPQFQDMMRGFDNKVFQVDRQLWEFGQLALEMNLADTFKENEAKYIIPKLEQTTKGKDWVKKFKDFLQVEGWRMVAMNDLIEPYWLEDPSIPIKIVKNYIMKPGPFVLEQKRPDLVKKREAAVAAVLNKVEPDEKEMFKGLIELAQKCAVYSEEHDLYCELYIHALMRRAYLEIGRRFAQKETIDKAEDIFMLNFDEIDRAIVFPDGVDLRFITKRRRSDWEEWHTLERPPVITKRSSMEEAIGLDVLPSRDPVLLKIVVGELPEVKPDLKADLFGVCGSAGVAEGQARVVTKYEQLKEVQPGEIVVCPGTNPAWTPIFGMIKGLVSDRGGTLSHAAIVGREYGIPTIVNTFQGTATIKTGQRIRVDANQGAIFILDK